MGSSPSSSSLSHAWSARCPVSASVGVSSCPASAVYLVAPWPSPLALGPALSRTPSSASGASKLYSRRGCMLFLDLAPSALLDCCGRGPTLLLSVTVPPGCGGAAVLGSRAMPPLQPSAPLSLLARVVGDFPSPPCPCPSSPVTPSPAVSTLGVSSPRGNASTPWVSMPYGDSTPPPTPWRSPPGVFRHSVGISVTFVSPHSGGFAHHYVDLAALPFSSHSIGLACRVFLPAGEPLPSRGSCPMVVS